MPAVTQASILFLTGSRHRGTNSGAAVVVSNRQELSWAISRLRDADHAWRTHRLLLRHHLIGQHRKLGGRQRQQVLHVRRHSRLQAVCLTSMHGVFNTSIQRAFDLHARAKLHCPAPVLQQNMPGRLACWMICDVTQKRHLLVNEAACDAKVISAWTCCILRH